MTNEAKQLLKQLQECYHRGSFAQACHGEAQKAAHELEAIGLAIWKGNSFGSNFYSVTEKGLSHDQRTP